MDYKKFGDKYIVRLEIGEEIVETLTNFIKKEGIKLGRVSGIGAVDYAKIGLFSTRTKKYHSKELKGDMEIVNLAGNISTMDGKEYLHLHIAVGDEDLNLFGGHLDSATVSATAEIVIDLIDGEVDREVGKDLGINLIKF